MNPEIAIQAVVGLVGVAVGVVTAIIAMRKMPGEIASTDSQTLQNVMNANKLMSDQLRAQQREIDELRSWFSGTIEIRTRLEMTNPPRVLTAEVRRIPANNDAA